MFSIYYFLNTRDFYRFGYLEAQRIAEPKQKKREKDKCKLIWIIIFN